MMGKLFLFAFIGVSLVQVNAVPDFIESGLEKIYNLLYHIQGFRNDVIIDINSNREVMPLLSVSYFNLSEKIKNENLVSLQKLTLKMEKKAQETPKPESVLRCIKVHNFICKEKLEKANYLYKNVALKNITSTQSSELDSIFQFLATYTTHYILKLSDCENMVNQCKDKQCVDNVVNKCTKWIEETATVTINNMFGKNDKVFGDFEGLLDSHMKTCINSQTDAMNAAKTGMKQCFNGTVLAQADLTY